MSPQLLVADIDRALEFYTEKLGFDIDFRYKDFYAGIIKDGYSIHLKVNNPLLKKVENKGSSEDLDIVFSIEGIEDVYEEFSNKSIPFIQPLRKMNYGKEFYITDPDSNIIAFVEEA